MEMGFLIRFLPRSFYAHENKVNRLVLGKN